MNGINMPDVFVGRYDEDVVEDKGIGKRVRVTHSDERCTDDQRTSWRYGFIEQVAPSFPPVRGLDPWNTG